MKLRIRGNSIRFRVSQSELRQIAEQGFAEDTVTFGPGQILHYRVEVVPAGRLKAAFFGSQICLRVPSDRVQRWSGQDEVAIAGEQAIGNGQTLEILLEKDFHCLAPRTGEDESDLFPNPAATTG
jgi:hypothetical protein